MTDKTPPVAVTVFDAEEPPEDFPPEARRLLDRALERLDDHFETCPSDDHAVILADDEALLGPLPQGRALPGGGAYALVTVAQLRAFIERALEDPSEWVFGALAPGHLPVFAMVEGHAYPLEIKRLGAAAEA